MSTAQRLASQRSRIVNGVMTALILLVGFAVMARWAGETARDPLPQGGVPGITLTAAEDSLAHAFPPSTNGTVPVLTYHDISDTGSRYSVTPELFTAQMQALADAGFRTIPLSTMQAWLAGEPIEMPARPIILTFDDGSATTYTTVDPILAARGWTASAFLISSTIVVGDKSSSVLNEGQIRRMVDSGRWEFGGHTADLHRQVDVGEDDPGAALTNRVRLADGSMETYQQWYQRADPDIAANQARLTELIGAPATTFAFPYGASGTRANDPRIRAGIDEILTRHGFTTSFGSGDATGENVGIFAVSDWMGEHRLPRIGMTANRSVSGLLESLRSTVPDKVPTSFATLGWAAVGGSCTRTTGASLGIKGRGTVWCTPEVNASSWGDIDLSFKAAGVGAEANLAVTVRDSRTTEANSRVEVVIGGSGFRVTRYTQTGPIVLAERDLPEATGSTKDVRLELRGERLVTSIDGTKVSAEVGPGLTHGGIRLGMYADPDKAPTAILVSELHMNDQGSDVS